MPLYTVYRPPGLSADQRADIAQAITEAHVSITGAPAFLVKVIFIPLDASSYFTGGHAESTLLRIVGVIRAGRSTEDRQKLLMKIHNDIKDHGYEVEIHLEDMKSENILVNGKFIPEPGSEGEKQWKQAGKPV